MTISARTKSLLDRIPAGHALTPAITAAVIAAHGAAEKFAARKSELAQAGNLTSKGQHQELRNSLVHQFGKDLARSSDPIRKAKKEIQNRRAAMKVKSIDKTDVVSAMERKEIRDYFNQLDPMARQTLALTTKDPRLLEALVTVAPELSGFTGNLTHVLDQVEQRYLELSHPDEIAALNEMQAVVDEGEAAIGVAKVLIKGTSDLDDRQFELLMKPIEMKIGAPWLLKSTRGLPGVDQVEIIKVVELDGGSASYRDATEADIANGVYYKDKAEYFAAQGLAA